MNDILKILLLSVLFLGLLTLLLGKKLGYKRTALLILAVLVVEAVFVGVRNYACFYDTPEEAFAATQFEKSRAEAVLVGEETAFVVGTAGAKHSVMILEKTEKGWRVGHKLKKEEWTIFLSDGSTALVFHPKGTVDYYVEILFLLGGEHSVTDSCGSAFQRVSSPGGSASYYAWLRGWEEDYAIIVDGEAHGIEEAVELSP